MSPMSRRSILLSFLPLTLLVFRQSPDPNAAHIKEWTERNAQYSAPKITETDSSLEITTNDPRPLDNVLDALVHQHGWHINYEDPLYGKSDILDNTAPSWLKDHPNGPRAYVVKGGAFDAKIPIDGYLPDDPRQILPALVKAYNRSGNPGRFELRPINGDEFDIVPTPTAEDPQKAILDTVMTFDTKDSDSADSNLKAFCDALSRENGQAVEFWRPYPTGTSYFPAEAKIRLHVQNQPARDVLRKMLRQVTSTMSWRLFYDTDLRKFRLMFR